MADHPPALRAEIAALKTELARVRDELAMARKTIQDLNLKLRREQTRPPHRALTRCDDKVFATMNEERDAAGRAVVYPTVSCGAEAVQDSIVVMDLFMATSPEHMPKGNKRVVTVLPPELALNLAEQLRSAAERVQAARADKKG